MTEHCYELGSLEFERYWGNKCNVMVYHMTTYFKGCSRDLVVEVEDSKNLKMLNSPIWGSGGCFNCVYQILKKSALPERIDVLKIQRMDRNGTVADIYDGAQYTFLADLFTQMPEVAERVHQVVMTVSTTSVSLVDNVGREAEHGWNMWGARMFLGKFGAFASSTEQGPFHLRPLQYDYLLKKIPLDTSISYYHHSFIRIKSAEYLASSSAEFAKWQPVAVPELQAEVPKYCRKPSKTENEEMQKWIVEELNVRCQPYRLAVPCDHQRLYEPFIPCQQELMNHLAEDYAAMKRWCDFRSSYAEIPALKIVDSEASAAFQKPAHAPGSGKVRLAFMFTVYSDPVFVKRLVSLLYGPDHYYLLHIDPAGSTPEFERDMRQEIAEKYAEHRNVFVTRDVPIVYGASTATIVLTKTMAWFNRYASGWDYFVAVTGSDYPLMPLHRFEKILQHQQPPMPFVMAWTPGTSTHLFRLQKTHPGALY